MNIFEYSIMNCPKIVKSRRARVIDILSKQYHISSWQDLMNWTPTYNYKMEGLTVNEVKALAEMREMQKTLYGRKEKAKADLYGKLAKFTSKHETTRIFNILVNHKIESVVQLVSAEEEQLKNLPGIGKKSWAILLKIRLGIMARRLTRATFQQAALPLTY